MVSDQTEVLMHEKQVLALADQVQRSLAGRKDYVNSMLTDIQAFNQAKADIVEAKLEQISEAIAQFPDAKFAGIREAAAELHRTLHQGMRYHNVMSLSYGDATLVSTGDIVAQLVASTKAQYPQIDFSTGILPGVVANREILTAVLEQLLLSVASLPVLRTPARIFVGSQGEFLTTTLCVAGWGMDFSQLLIEEPVEKQPLDWTITSDLDLAPVRRMIAHHGGELFIGPTSDGCGVQFSFSIGNAA